MSIPNLQLYMRRFPTFLAASVIGILAAASGPLLVIPAAAQTALGELENRPAPVFRRICVSGANAGSLCKQNSECPGSTCRDRNIYNISVAVHFNASNAQLTSIQNAISSGSAILFDATDGQAEIGLATIHNNAFGTTQADLRVYPASASTGWWANTGSWKAGGSMHISINNIANGAPGEAFAHEFIHLAFDARDEYEGRAPGCGDLNGSNSCPIPATVTAGETVCLMDNGGLGSPDGQFSELCWGQGDITDPTDISGGNHDAENDTEQSVCRSNRSCWDQVVWSWPNTILKPAAAPDPAANGKTVNATQFLVIDNTARGVLVLDESGSMGLESPTRMSRLQVAASDFVALADSATELGLVSYATNANPGSGRINIAINPLNAANRAALAAAVTGLGPATRTNIGAGLQTAKDMIDAAGGVTGNTFVVLMTDGVNNEPSPPASAAADLQAKIDDLLSEGIAVYVTCTGGDLGLQSQCSEIAAGTGGFYVDSADAADLPPSFAEIQAFVEGYDMVGEETNMPAPVTIRGAAQLRNLDIESLRMHKLDKKALKKLDRQTARRLRVLPRAKAGEHKFYIEEKSESALFTIQWRHESAQLNALLVSPGGETYDMNKMPLGQFLKVREPEPGVWRLRVEGAVKEFPYETKAYSRNPVMNLAGGVRHASVRPGDPIYIYAYPNSFGRALSHPVNKIPVVVTRPDGVREIISLHDHGRDKNGEGDDVADDGIFTGVYRPTKQKGAYDFTALFDMEEWWEPLDAVSHHHEHAHEQTAKERAQDHEDNGFQSPKFVRMLKLSAAVADPEDVVRESEDPPAGKDPDPNDPRLRYPIDPRSPQLPPVQPDPTQGLKDSPLKKKN